MMTSSEQFVVNHLDANYGVRLTKIPEADTKSPDFELLDGTERSFVAELKDIEVVPVSKETGWTITDHPDGIREAERKSNAVSRVAEKVCDAAKQLQRYPESKGIIFLNHDNRVRFDHLREAYSGCQIYSNSEFTYQNVAAIRITEGRLKQAKDKVDFLIWIDLEKTEVRSCFFGFVSEAGRTILARYFKAPFLVEPARVSL
jgi:hypothetical protein